MLKMGWRANEQERGPRLFFWAASPPPMKSSTAQTSVMSDWNWHWLSIEFLNLTWLEITRLWSSLMANSLPEETIRSNRSHWGSGSWRLQAHPQLTPCRALLPELFSYCCRVEKCGSMRGGVQTLCWEICSVNERTHFTWIFHEKSTWILLILYYFR